MAVRVVTRFLGRADRVVTWKRTRVYAFVLCCLYVVAWCWEVLTGVPPLNDSGQPIAGDFIAFYTAGKLVLLGEARRIYDHDRVASLQHEILQGHAGAFFDAFRNPPFFALPFAPLALLDLLPAAAVWFAIGSVFLVLSVWLLIEEIPYLKQRWRGLAIIVFAFPPVYFGLIDGENSALSLLLYVLIYRALVREREVQAGVWAALGLFKPQLFVVFPFVLLVRRMWRGLLAYAVVACVLAVVSLAVVGPSGLQAWGRVLVDPEGGNTLANGWRMASLKSFLDLLLPDSTPLTLGLYVIGSVALLAVVAAAWSDRRTPPQLAWIVTCLTAVLIDFHLVDYDLTVLVSAGVFLTSLAGLNSLWLVALYLSTLLRVSVPIGAGSLQVTTLILIGITCVALNQVLSAHRSAFRRLSLAGT